MRVLTAKETKPLRKNRCPFCRSKGRWARGPTYENVPGATQKAQSMTCTVCQAEIKILVGLGIVHLMKDPVIDL